MSRLLSLIATTCLTLLIAGCNTLSVDIIVPDAVSQNEPFVFEAVADPDAVGQIAYEWYLDDIIISSQPIDNAIIATAGLHTLRVKITDEEGETGEADVDLSVIAAEVLNADFAVNVFAYNMDEEPLADVTVTIDGSTSLTNTEGVSAFSGLTQTPVLVVSAQKEGYIPQSYRFDLNGTQQSADVELTLMERAAPVTFNNDSEITVNGDSLNTLVTLPASAFVDSDGNPVTGEITAVITPIDTREMGASYLGGGVALTDESEVVQLLSLGMIDFEFTQNDQPLQLAADASATIEMDLTTTTGPDGRVYTIGEEIEMWWFDDVNGLWVEEGVGEIVASATSPTGMRLIATVEHFTTWNWDYYKEEDRASFDLTCTIEGQTLTENQSCYVTVYTDGFHRSMSVSADGVTAINLAPSMDLTAAGTFTSDDGTYYYGQTSFTTITGVTTVSLDLSEASATEQKNHRVKCYLDDGNTVWSTECRGQITVNQYYGRQFSPQAGKDYAEFRLYPGEELPIIVSIQGQIISDTVSHPEDGSKLSLEYNLESDALEFACFGTLSGSQGEYFPCQAIATDDSGNLTSVRLGDFSGSPLSAPLSYLNDAMSLQIEVASAFTATYIRDFISSGEQSIYTIAPDSGSDTLLLNTTTDNDQKIVASFDIEPELLYTYSCEYEGQTVPCFATGTFRSDVTNPGDYAPSWMRDRLVVKSPEDLTPEKINATGPGPDDTREQLGGASGYLETESLQVDHGNRHVTFSMILVPYPA